MKKKNTNKDIVKSNALIEAMYEPGSVYKMRLLMAALMQIKAKEKLDHNTDFVVTANALADLTGSAARNNFRELAKAADELLHTVIEVSERPNGEKGRIRKRKINLTSGCEYVKNEGKVVLNFGAHAVPYISNLSKRFTQYQAKYVMPMKSSYGIRLYELCLQWLGDEREFEVEEFKRMFALENKYSKVAELKRKVIDPALRDINTYSDIRVDFGQRKAGRIVSHFQFRITKSAPKAKPLAIEKWMNEYNIGKGETLKTLSKTTKDKYEKYKIDPSGWVQSELGIQ